MIPIVFDRLKESFLALIGAATPRVDYFTTYRCKVVKQSADAKAVDLLPDDNRIPQCQDVPIKWGLPGVKAQFSPGTYMLLGWENGDPSRRYACCIEDATVTKLVLNATEVYLGAEQGAKKLATESHTHTFSVNPGPLPTITITTDPPIPAGLTVNTKGA